jgi:flagellar motility protein MotE (MotC chaperone)
MSSKAVVVRARGVRLIDGVVIAAVALLALKVLGIMSWLTTPAPPAPANELPAFARVLAHARTNYEPPDVTTTGTVGAKAEHGAPAAAAEPAPTPAPPAAASASIVSPSERLILERLSERRDQLQQKGREAEIREKLMQESERRIDQRIDELKALKDKVDPPAEKKAEIEAVGLKNLVTMYEAMKPKDAARVFDRLPQPVLVSVVQQMNPRKMAEVLAAMSPDSAQKLTVALANRSASPAVADAGAAGALPPGELPAIDSGRP